MPFYEEHLLILRVGALPLRWLFDSEMLVPIMDILKFLITWNASLEIWITVLRSLIFPVLLCPHSYERDVCGT